MKKLHYLSLDGELLQTLVTIYTEGSVTKAAHKLNQSQSTLSHRLDRLRAIIGDEVFVRAGRSIVPTEHTEEIIEDAKIALVHLERMIDGKSFDAAKMTDQFVIAATDYERALFLIDAYRDILRLAPNIRLDFVWDKYSNSVALRNNEFDLAISPIEGIYEQDIHSRALIVEGVRCYYDHNAMDAPDTIEKYLAANHVRVIFSEADPSFVDNALQLIGRSRKISINMPSISELPRLMWGTRLVATLPARLQHSIMSDFSACHPPFEMASLTYSLFWHERSQNSPKHIWLREQIIASAAAKKMEVPESS